MNQTDKVEVQHYGAGLVVVFTSHEVDGAKCGTCTMCCETTPVVFPDYQKPAHTPCPFQGPEGCLDYEDHPNTVWLFFHEDSPALWGKARFVKRAVGLLAGKALPNFPETDDLVLVDLEQREEDDAESESGSL